MKKSLYFFRILMKKCKENELLLMSNALTYRLLISLFPLIIFIMTILGFLNLDIYIKDINLNLPQPILDILYYFSEEVLRTKRISLLSTSFLFTIYSSSKGFASIIQGLNRAYELEDKRNFFIRRGVSVIFVFIFVILINFSLILFVFSDYIKSIIIKYTSLEFIPYFLDSLFLNILIFVILLIMVLVIYKISICKKVTLFNIFPGGLVTVFTWLILSKAFNLYINNFSKYSRIYGSIGGIFVLVIWINMISLILLVGGQINAIWEKGIDY